jgi:hypothetical protein
VDVREPIFQFRLLGAQPFFSCTAFLTVLLGKVPELYKLQFPATLQFGVRGLNRARGKPGHQPPAKQGSQAGSCQNDHQFI